MKNVRSTVLGVLMILGAIVNAGNALMDGDPTTEFDFTVTAAAISGGVAMIWMREQKQHEGDKK